MRIKEKNSTDGGQMSFFPLCFTFAGNKGNNYAQQIVQRIKTETLKMSFPNNYGSPTMNNIWLYHPVAETLLFPSLFEGFGLPIIEDVIQQTSFRQQKQVLK